MRTEILKNITTKIGSGATPTGGQNAYHSEGISLIRSQNVLDFLFSKNGLAFIDDSQAKELNNVTVEENDILLNITGDSIARVCIVPKEILPARVNQHVSIIRADETVNSQYLFYYLQYLKPYLLKICGVGGTRNALTKEVIGELEISISENQNEIAEILSVIDSKISLNNRINTELEAMSKTIYNYWFVQFDFPNEEGKPYKASGGEMKYNEKLKTEIPVGWEDCKLEEIILIHDSKRIPLSSQERENKKGIYPYYGATEIMDYLDEYIFDGTYVLMAEDGSVMDKNGNPVLQYIWGKSWVNNHAHVLEGKEGISNEYLHLMLKNISVISIMSGSIQKKINQDNLKNAPIVKVPNQYLIELDKIILPIYSKLKLIFEENKELITLRDFLLPLLMNGQVKVV